MNSPDSDDLSAKLQAWTVAPKVPDSFQREVWQRIAVRQTERENTLLPQIVRWFSTQLVRPQFATVIIAFALMASVGVAHMEAQETKAKHWKELEARYAASVDPLAMSR